MARRVSRRRALSTAGWIALLLLLVSILADRAGLFGARGNDWETFDRNRFLVARVTDGDTITVLSLSGETRVRLLGIDAPELNRETSRRPDFWAERAASYARARSEGRIVTLQLDNPQTRDRYGRLLAYVYLSDTDCLNLAMIRDGHAYADRRFKHTFRPQFEMAENEARKKQRGLWQEVTVEQMPEWRQKWLEQLERSR